MTPAPNPAGLAHRPDLPQDQPGKPVPAGIAEVLTLLRILITYGLHIGTCISRDAKWPAFPFLARFMGGVNLEETLARILRGIRRAAALERVLRRRAERGRDLQVLAPRIYEPRIYEPRPAKKDHPQAEAERRCRKDQTPLSYDTLPTIQDLEAEVRRRPVGSTIAAICLDLGISPSLCTGWFWNKLFSAMLNYRGNLTRTLVKISERDLKFQRNADQNPDQPPAFTRESLRQTLGFFIGEPPTMSLWPPGLAAATGTGPP